MKGLAEFQELLARLYVDHDFRESFFRNRVSYTTSFDSIYKENLIALDQNQTETFARSLVLKRFGVVITMLPVMGKYYLDTVKNHFLKYGLNTSLSLLSGKHIADRNHFLAYLKKNVDGDLYHLTCLYYDDIKKSESTVFILKKQEYQLDRFWDVITKKPQKSVSWVVYIKLWGRVLLDFSA